MTVRFELETWQRVLTDDLSTLREELADTVADTVLPPAQIERLRRSYSREEVDVAWHLTLARRKAAAKFERADQLVGDVAGVEQASGQSVAQHKAERFRGAPSVADLCCGIGGDTMALGAVTENLRAIDHDPVRAFMAGRNASLSAEVLDIEECAVGEAWLHIDPARRDESSGRRLWSYEDFRPGPEVIEALIAAAPAAAVKFGPGMDWSEFPNQPSREIEVIGDGRSLLQAVMWCGSLARSPGSRTATRLRDGISYTARPDDFMRVAEDVGRYLLFPDPALERAGLVGPRIADTPAEELALGLGILTSTEPIDDPWLQSHEILVTLPWRTKKIREWLRGNDGGLVTVRTRGGAVDANREQVALRGEGSRTYTLFGLRLDRRKVCIICAG